MLTGSDQAAVDAAALEPLERSEIEGILSQAVLRADVHACGERRQGTVTMLRSDGGPVGYTNAHVVEGASSAQVSGGRLGVADAPVERFLSRRDMAVVDLRELEPPRGVGLESGPVPALGEPVLLAGFPAGSWQVLVGEVTSVEVRNGWGDVTDVILVDVPVEQGFSGGVVVDRRGRAVGLIAARDPGTGFAVAYPVQDVLTRAAGQPPDC